jgi:hypothetical protein
MSSAERRRPRRRPWRLLGLGLGLGAVVGGARAESCDWEALYAKAQAVLTSNFDSTLQGTTPSAQTVPFLVSPLACRPRSGPTTK